MDPVISEQAVVLEPPQDNKAYVSRRGRRILTALLALLIIILLVAFGLLTQLLGNNDGPEADEIGGVTWIRSIYGYGPDISQMTEPASAAIPSEGGTIWVADQGRFRIVKYDANGRYLGVFEGDTANGDKFDYPSRIALAPDGWLYVVQSTYNTVKAYDENGTLRQTLNIPSPMSVAANDEMVVIGAQSGFAAYDREGQLIGIIGVRGIEDDQFDTVNGVALDDENNAYIVDTFNNRISKYDAEGERVWIVETGRPANRAGSNMDPGDAEKLAEEYPAMMQAPMGATIDGAGRLVVVDLLDFSIAAFDTEDGSVLGKWGTFGREDGKFMYPADIDYDAVHDWFVVSDSGNQRAQIIRVPDSGDSAAAAARRLLSGPLKACLIPLLLLLLVLAVVAVVRALRKRSAQRQAELAENQAFADSLSDS